MTRIIDSAAAEAPSPDALLKAAVSGGKPAAAPAEVPAPGSAGTARRIDVLRMGLAGAGLALGLLLGAGTAMLALPRTEGAAGALAEIRAVLEANRLDASRLSIASDRLDASVAALKEAADIGRHEAGTRGTALTEKVGKVEAVLLGRIVALGERIDQAEKEQAARIAALAERRPAAAPAPAAKAEPVQTGSLAEAKPKPGIVDAWAVRDVYDGTAILEDRRRRLIEVAAGDTIPGIGRVEGVERRGREWVVVTRQGLVTPQPW